MLRNLLLLLCATAALAASPEFGEPVPTLGDRSLTTDYAQQALSKLVAGLDITAGRLPRVAIVENYPTACMAADHTIYVGKAYLERNLGVSIESSPRGINDAIYRIMHDAKKLDYFASTLGHELGHYRANDARSKDLARDDFGNALGARQELVRDLFAPADRQVFVDAINGGGAAPHDPGFGVWPTGPRDVMRSHVHEYMADQHSILANYLRTEDLQSALRGKIRPYDAPYTVIHPGSRAATVNALAYVQSHPEVFAGALTEPLTVPVDGGVVVLERDGDAIRARGLDEQLARLKPEERVLLQTLEKTYARQRAMQDDPHGLVTPEQQAMRPRGATNAGEAPVAAGRGEGAPPPAPPSGLLGVEAEPVAHPAARAAAGFASNAVTGIGIGLGTNAIDQYLKNGAVDWDKTTGLLKDPEFWRTSAGNIVGGTLGALVPGGKFIKLAGSIAGATVGGSLAGSEKPQWGRLVAGTAGSIAGAALLGWFPGGAIVGGVAGGMVADWAYDKFTAPASPALRGASFLP
jgi:hypothetical protein